MAVSLQPAERSYLLIANPTARFTQCINGIIDRTREHPSRGLEIAKFISDLSVVVISALGFPVGNSSDISLKCFIITDTTPKAWAGFNYVNSHFKSMNIRQKLCPEKNSKFYYITTTAGIILEVSIGVLSHLPDFRRLEFSTEVNGTVILESIGDGFLRTLSTHLMIKATPKLYNYWKDSPQVRLFWLKQEFVQAIKQMKEQFIQMTNEERNGFVKQLNSIREGEISSVRIGDYLSKMLQPAEKNLESSSFRKTMMKVGKFAFFLAFVVYPFMAYPLYNWQLSKGEGISDGGAGLLSIFPCAALYLNFKCTLRTVRQFYPVRWNLTSQLKKVKAVAYKALGVLLSAAGVYGFQKTEQCIVPALSVNIPPAFCIPYSLYLFTIANVSIHDFIDHALEESILSGENQEEREQILMKREFDKLIELIENTPLEMFATTFKDLPNLIKAPLLQKFGFTDRDLEVLF